MAVEQAVARERLDHHMLLAGKRIRGSWALTARVSDGVALTTYSDRGEKLGQAAGRLHKRIRQLRQPINQTNQEVNR